MTDRAVTLMLCGDVMLGRGIDQVLAVPSPPLLHEPWVRDARRYVTLAEQRNGSIPRPVDPAWVWGDALAVCGDLRPDLRLVNLETAVTRSDAAEPKGINYRMHPANVGCLRAAGIDACVLANNHVLDWGQQGLLETLDTLRAAGVATAGAGRDEADAARPAALPLGPGRRALVFGMACGSSGVPGSWRATAARPGVHRLPDLSPATAAAVAARVRAARQPGDLVVASIHWGPNWGYAVPDEHRAFARRLVDEAGCDLVHGHSSHHPLGLEVHRGRAILYGCGDLVNDYEGIEGHERFRPDLALLYFATLAPDGRLERLLCAPFRIARFRLGRASRADARWLAAVLDRESRDAGVRVALTAHDMLAASWRRLSQQGAGARDRSPPGRGQRATGR